MGFCQPGVRVGECACVKSTNFPVFVFVLLTFGSLMPGLGSATVKSPDSEGGGAPDSIDITQVFSLFFLWGGSELINAMHVLCLAIVCVLVQLVKALTVLHESVSANEKIVVHCSAGSGRTGQLLAGWRASYHGVRRKHRQVLALCCSCTLAQIFARAWFHLPCCGSA